jgi:DNA-binding winged helix-turn-helix (wHTH) protein
LIFRFGDYSLDTDRHELRRAGTELPVEPQVFDLLAILIRNRERVVSKEELLAAIWGGRLVSDSTMNSRINLARNAIGDSGADQRYIRTVPRKGFRFVGEVHEQEGGSPAPGEAATKEAPAAVSSDLRQELPDFVELSPKEVPPPISPELYQGSGVAEISPSAPAPARGFRSAIPMTALVLSASLLMVIGAATLLFFSSLFSWPRPEDPARGAPTAQAAATFDPSLVPLIDNDMRRALANYASRPDAKALAIARARTFVADGAPDIETAKRNALRDCSARATTPCRLYAVGTQVVWSSESLQLPAPRDLHTKPLQTPLDVDQIPTLGKNSRQQIADRYMKLPNHRALAIARGGYASSGGHDSPEEAIRLALEWCADLMPRECLLLSVNGFLTIEIPKSRSVTRLFLPSSDPTIPADDRERIAKIYQGKEWRALARGKAGSWHAVAAAPSEAAAVEAVLSLCAQADDDCRLYAIGNFRTVE